MNNEAAVSPEEQAVVSAIFQEDAQAECLARANFYRLLAGAFVEEPSRDYLAALRSAPTLEALGALGVAFDEDFLGPPLERLEDALAVEYAVLFASSGGFPPVESVRRQGGFQQAAHTEVCGIYRRWGFRTVPGRFRVFEDQLGIELQFVAALLERCYPAMIEGDNDALRRLEKEIKRFWALHLGLWVRGYCELIERAAQHSFYREMARLLRAFAEAELELLGVRVADEDGGRYRLPKSEIAALQGGDGPVCGGRA